MKTLIWDIELSKAVALIYPSHKPQYVDPSNILHNQFMPCAAWKWEHEEEIHLASVLDNKKKFKKDYRDHTDVVSRLYEAVKEADILVGHNSDGFDLKHLNWYAALQGLPPLPQKQSVDTLKAVRSVFRAPSNRLDELAKALVGDKKQETSKGMHNRVALGCPDAIAEMGVYNIQDIKIQEQVYLYIRPWMKSHPKTIVRDTYGETVNTCQYCKSPNLTREKVRYLKSGRARQQWKCKEEECGGYTTTDLIK